MSNQGKKVKTHYRGTLDDGTQFDSSYDRGEPLEFTCGAGQMIKGFDAAVVDMQVGEKKTVHIPAADAYGEHNPEMVLTFPAEQVPNIEQIEKGMKLFLSTPSGMPVPAVVIDVTPEAVTLDANHELAGKDLNFDIELVEVEGYSMPERLVSTTCLGNLNDPSYELLLRRELGGVFEVDELLLDWDQADVCAFAGVTELGRTIDVRPDATDGGRLADGDVLAIDRSGMVPVAVVVRLRSAEVYLVEVDRMDPIALAHACWEIGNMHAPLFRGDSDEHTVRMYTPVQPVLGRMLRGVEGVRLSVVTRELDADRRFASSAAEVVVSMAPDFTIVKKTRG